MKTFNDYLDLDVEELNETSVKFETHFERAMTALDTLLHKTPEAKKNNKIEKLIYEAMDALYEAHQLTND